MLNAETKRARLFGTGALVISMVLWASLASAKVCTPDEAAKADEMVDHLDSWAQVNIAYKKYGHCDDGEIAEGNSEAVARLLVDQWNTLPQLNALIKGSPTLKTFVIHHIDGTLDTADLEKIKALSGSSCPADAAALCHDLARAATKAE
ncbi:MAG: hypothetical protein PW843_29000 [Azospirillaceae bacterium]|nr:hypothetical protein [Azospirillaceae bacterium]